MIDAVLSDAKTHMDKAVDALRTDLQTIRTGRASPALIERLHVEYYGVSTPLIRLPASRSRGAHAGRSTVGQDGSGRH